ncbi:hypothetical protein [Pseudomonas glycinae]|uniref:Uncharacterized protein n=1 Tax=Pseudomonas glycinae TaxID=1785145 RepID=A0ABM5ZTJ4_9PSED|nr:hypothetical protein [Pseudomonas glycinae]AMQ87070.1 hypothetical protein AWU82_08820 [Pseudomonas glycinae]NKF27296.1 hypothetical protein [Pseudomonas sp. BG5]
MSSRQHDLCDVQDAAGNLLGQALTIGNRHLAFGIARVQFHQQVAYFAKQITEEVADGRLTPQQGINALAQEQRNLLIQSRALQQNRHGTLTGAARTPHLSMLPHAAATPDPQRLLRAVRQQNLRVTRLNSAPLSSVHPVNDLRFFPREHWPQELPAPEEPGFYIVPKSLSAEKLQAQLFPSPNPNVIAKFKSLNQLDDVVKAGTLIVLSDPDNQQCTYEESLLMETAHIVSMALAPLTVEEADFFAQHYEVIRRTLSDGSKVIGVGTAMAANHLDGIKAALKDIEELHTSTIKANGSLNSKAFKKRRAGLLQRLDGQLTGLTKRAIGLPDYPNLKIALGIEHPHRVHRWRKAGGIGQTPGYSTHIQGVVKASQYIKYGGWIGTAVGGGASAMKVQDVCTNGSAEACKKVKYTEAGSFLGGAVGSAVGASAASTICVAIGVSTAGIAGVLCGVLVAGAGSFTIGSVGEKGGEIAGELIYEKIR